MAFPPTPSTTLNPNSSQEKSSFSSSLVPSQSQSPLANQKRPRTKISVAQRIVWVWSNEPPQQKDKGFQIAPTTQSMKSEKARPRISRWDKERQRQQMTQSGDDL